MALALVAFGAGMLLLGWVIYPLMMYIVAVLRSRKGEPIVDGDRAATLIIATRDDPAMVAARIDTLERDRHELKRLGIVVAVDHTAAWSATQYRKLLAGRAIVAEGDPPGGKAATLNSAVRQANEDVLIFTDSAQQFLPGTLASLVHSLQGSSVGAATGQFKAASNRSSLLLQAFWIYETWLRRTEASVDSLVGVTGAVYSMRRDLWRPLPAGLINDDLFVPLSVSAQGYRVVTCESALALDQRVFTATDEFRRKVRTLTGILQLCSLLPWILNPLRNRLWIQFVCHKLLRFCTPYWVLLSVIGVAAFLPWKLLLLMLAIVSVALAAASMAPVTSLPFRAVRQMGWTLLILWAPFVATANALRGDWNVWSSVKSR